MNLRQIFYLVCVTFKTLQMYDWRYVCLLGHSFTCTEANSITDEHYGAFNDCWHQPDFPFLGPDEQKVLLSE